MNIWSERIRHWSKSTPDAIAVADERWAITFRELESITTQLVARLKSAGVQPSDRVILALPRSTSLAVIAHALLRAEFCGLVIDRGYIASTIGSVSFSLQPKAVISLKADHSLVMSKLGPMAKKVEEIGFQLHHLNKADEFIALIDRSKASEVESPPDLRWLLQTSGTTKDPRLVMIGEENLSVRAIGEVRDFKLTGADRVLNHLSFSHDLGLNQLLSTLIAGAGLRIQTGPLILSLAKALKEFKPSGITGTPMMWTQLLAATKEQFPSLRYLTVSGGSLATAALEELQLAFPNASIFRTYGQSETFRTLLNAVNSDPSLGFPIPGVNAFLVNCENSESQIDEPGELVHAGDGAMLGYWQDVNSTRQKLTSTGIRTGDLFRQDAKGAFHYIGRNDDMLKRFEHRFNICEIESAIFDEQGIAKVIEEVAVVAKPAPPKDPRQVLLAAFVRLADGATLTPDDLLRDLQQKLPSFKVPDRVIVLTEFPRTVSFKIDRSALQKTWLAER